MVPEEKAQILRESQALAERLYGPKYPCMFVFGFFATNPSFTKTEDSFTYRLYLPDRVRRMLVTVRQYYRQICIKLLAKNGAF